MIEIMKQVAALKRAYLAGSLTKQQVAEQFTALLVNNKLMDRDLRVEVDEIPPQFWEICGCVFCRAERGESPLPLDAVVEVESLRAGYHFGMITKLEALMRISQIFRKNGITEEQANQFWYPQTGVPPKFVRNDQNTCMPMSSLRDGEKAFFSALEEQMKNVPKKEEEK